MTRHICTRLSTPRLQLDLQFARKEQRANLRSIIRHPRMDQSRPKQSLLLHIIKKNTQLEYFLYQVFHPSEKDIVTSIFDLFFLYSGYTNVRQLLKDKEVKGFDYRNMILYLAWNIWSTLVIYPEAQLYLANVINFFYLLTQLSWVIIFFHYQNLFKRTTAIHTLTELLVKRNKDES